MKITMVVIATFLMNVSVFANNVSNDQEIGENDNIFCTTQYDPATCTATYADFIFEANGSNKCYAIKNVYEKVILGQISDKQQIKWFVKPQYNDIVFTCIQQ